MTRIALGGLASSALVAAAGTAHAGVITIDGTADAAYGPALVVQNTQTAFGDNNDPAIDFANGSELDQGFGVVRNGILYLTLAGNVESNFNKLEVFIDSVPGGQNRLLGGQPDVDFNALNRMADDGSGNGLTFDAGFGSDYYWTFTGGNNPYESFSSFAPTDSSGGSGTFVGGGAGTIHLGGALGIGFAINNSNTAGVDAGTGPSSGAGVITGVEVGIPLEVIGLGSSRNTTTIKVTAFINGSGHDFLSNQVLGGIGGGDNLGEPRNVNFANIDGNQYFEVKIPTPGASALLGVAGLAALRRRRA